MQLRASPHCGRVYREKVRAKKSEVIENVLFENDNRQGYNKPIHLLQGLQQTYTFVASVNISGPVGMVTEMVTATNKQSQQQYSYLQLQLYLSLDAVLNVKV